LYKKSTAGESKPSYLGHVIVENRNGLVVADCATQSSTTAEREAALAGRSTTTSPKPITLGADKLYQEEKFIAALRERNIAPHVAEYEKVSTHWPNFLTQAERSDPRMAISQKKRKLVEMVFGWGKLDSIMRKIKLHGVTGWTGCFACWRQPTSGAHGEAAKANSGSVSGGSGVSTGRKQAPAEAKIRYRTAAQREKNDHGEKLQHR